MKTEGYVLQPITLNEDMVRRGDQIRSDHVS